jgi:hypothetical protein
MPTYRLASSSYVIGNFIIFWKCILKKRALNFHWRGSNDSWHQLEKDFHRLLFSCNLMTQMCSTLFPSPTETSWKKLVLLGWVYSSVIELFPLITWSPGFYPQHNIKKKILLLVLFLTYQVNRWYIMDTIYLFYNHKECLYAGMHPHPFNQVNN